MMGDDHTAFVPCNLTMIHMYCICTYICICNYTVLYVCVCVSPIYRTGDIPFLAFYNWLLRWLLPSYNMLQLGY